MKYVKWGSRCPSPPVFHHQKSGHPNYFLPKYCWNYLKNFISVHLFICSYIDAVYSFFANSIQCLKSKLPHCKYKTTRVSKHLGEIIVMVIHQSVSHKAIMSLQKTGLNRLIHLDYFQ